MMCSREGGMVKRSVPVFMCLCVCVFMCLCARHLSEENLLIAIRLIW